jgi:hypothetical protein
VGAKEGVKKLHWLSLDRMSYPKMKEGMGFRRFSSFNKAFLGKQCWRLLKDENSLMGRICKSRYFPRANLLDAPECYQPSYAWRSILSARDVVQKGVAWVIGNGRKVRIWKDRWVSPQSNSTIFSPVRLLHEDALVKELFVADSRMWNTNLIYQIFLPSEAHDIVNIPLTSSESDDFLFWSGERHGEYSVRSDHHLLCNEKVLNQSGLSSSLWDNLWKLIWKIPLPTRVRNFMWRLAHDIIPTRCTLRRRGVSLDVVCPLCFDKEESSQHLFMLCSFSQKVWFPSPHGILPPTQMDLNVWILNWLSSKEPLAVQLFCVSLWKIWFFRNQVIFNQAVFDLVVVASGAHGFVEEFNLANLVTRAESCLRPPMEWSAPPHNFLKVNIDAGRDQLGKVTWGLVIRNHNKEVVYAAMEKSEVVVEPLLA